MDKFEYITYHDAIYQVLSLEDYLKVYAKSIHDSYRKTKNNNKDLIKINAIKELLKMEGNLN
ncbi:hypothetical protein BAGA_09040 [Bacillus gaemokensis]|uniref:Uncharacterized protein n=1 Tax=Bacillus gaemokensis TaxID=574375 RepID=A0A073KM83_9BACI|nr:hypothetical protein BAGA_09040 [Bacillus gaemokensis]KYG25833.1 hypothetical protein AZF08_17520 [Bacillus gaemokensis]